MFYTPEQKGLTSKEIDEICERLWKETLDSAGDCHDCGVKPNKRHKEGCDCASCTSCGGQRLMCDCKTGKPSIWTGIWDGKKECYEQKLICYSENSSFPSEWVFDLNTWYVNSIKSKKLKK